ncbi:ImmA/IrrE family metallo-endopeptidase [Thalassospira xianhensis]|uniref:IrrE N-terminal-like domain-containing protein n=1 Tax=Thalassospira xianhensis MCCC 1A02616 TaxID=1177929 RepID=A0A367U6P8_9PROT|nr:ImmA/IrrE family metallo-endopeptidase [Thalassospira xianhensis]RCK03888.1 hypothetical protein TH5_22985 [Thalassospira xianhensis MCCC 1A02616]
MLEIDRMLIDDVGGNPVLLADSIIKQIPSDLPSVPLREIAAAIDIVEIREENLSGLEGVMIVDSGKSSGGIIVNINSSRKRKRFTIAHEIGHYVNPYHLVNSSDGFRCSRSDMSISFANPNDRRAKMELEANIFASNILMPTEWVRKYLSTIQGVELSHLIKMADKFDVSKEVAIRRYLNFADEPTAAVFSKDGVIRYIVTTSKFPRLSVWNGNPIPKDRSDNRKFEEGYISEVEEVPSYFWFENNNDIHVYDQKLVQRNGYQVNLISIEEDDDNDSYWGEPKFRR